MGKEIRNLSKSLQCILSDSEKLDLATEMGKESQEYQEALDRKKEVSQQLSADVESHRAAMQRIGSVLANGFEYRTVECILEIDRIHDKAKITRSDTGEVIERRKLKPSELQAEIPM